MEAWRAVLASRVCGSRQTEKYELPASRLFEEGGEESLGPGRALASGQGLHNLCFAAVTAMVGFIVALMISNSSFVCLVFAYILNQSSILIAV